MTPTLAAIGAGILLLLILGILAAARQPPGDVNGHYFQTSRTSLTPNDPTCIYCHRPASQVAPTRCTGR